MSQFIIVDMDNINQILTEHINRIDNPHRVKPADIELGNVDNTSDMDKPVSKATQELIDKTNETIKEIQLNLNAKLNEMKEELIKKILTNTDSILTLDSELTLMQDSLNKLKKEIEDLNLQDVKVINETLTFFHLS